MKKPNEFISNLLTKPDDELKAIAKSIVDDQVKWWYQYDSMFTPMIKSIIVSAYALSEKQRYSLARYSYGYSISEER